MEAKESDSEEALFFDEIVEFIKSKKDMCAEHRFMFLTELMRLSQHCFLWSSQNKEEAVAYCMRLLNETVKEVMDEQ